MLHHGKFALTKFLFRTEKNKEQSQMTVILKIAMHVIRHFVLFAKFMNEIVAQGEFNFTGIVDG
jgi:hypothetical protein